MKINREMEPVFSWKNEIDPLVDVVYYNGLDKRMINCELELHDVSSPKRFDVLQTYHASKAKDEIMKTDFYTLCILFLYVAIFVIFSCFFVAVVIVVEIIMV